MLRAHLEVETSKKHDVVARSTFPSQNVQSTSASEHFWKFGCWKVHAGVARSTYPTQNEQSTPCSEHFWKLRCRKRARRYGPNISKSKCTKRSRFGALFEVEMWEKCTPLWRDAHLEVKSVNNWRSRTTLGRSDVVSRGKRKGFCILLKVSKTWRFCSSFNYNHHYTTLHSATTTTTTATTLHYATLHSLYYTHYTKLHYTKLHYTPLDCTTLHYNY